MFEQVVAVFHPMTLPGALTALWVLVMISVPVVRWIGGEGAEHVGIAAGVFAQVAAVLAALVVRFGPSALIVVAIVPFLGWASELLGSRTGFPFGDYRYTDVLQPQVAHVPVLIPLAWLMMMPPAWAMGVLLAPERPVLQWVIAAAAFTAWDVYLDPMMVGWGFWTWRRTGAYLGIPIVNYVGWFAVTFAITALVALIGRAMGTPLVSGVPTGPLALIFAVTWLLMFIGQLAFWRLRVSALAGFVAMGVFVVLVIATGAM
jgi:putative membrane protein